MKDAKDLKSKILLVHLLDAASRSAATYKTPLVDMAGYDSCVFVLNVGVAADDVTWKLVEGDSTADASLTDVAAGEYEGTLSVCTGNTDDQTTAYLAYKGTKRYVGANITLAGTSLVSCNALVGHAEKEPITTTTSGGTART